MRISGSTPALGRAVSDKASLPHLAPQGQPPKTAPRARVVQAPLSARNPVTPALLLLLLLACAHTPRAGGRLEQDQRYGIYSWQRRDLLLSPFGFWLSDSPRALQLCPSPAQPKALPSEELLLLCREGSRHTAVPPEGVFLARSSEIKSREIALPHKNLHPQGRLGSQGKGGV